MNNADHYRVRVSAAVLRPRDELLVVRETRLAVEVLNLPGGAPQIGETLEHAVAREVLEETGYQINPTEIAFVAERREDRWSTSILEICFYAEIVSDVRISPIAHDSIHAVEWLALDHRDIRKHLPHADLFSARKRGRYIAAASKTTVS
ncbi:MAG TPA: NUDIX hydrolase [Candidatus Acidoferrales bacterium]|nr:NUDIX hydrolase [Candidatus Acidoferrales bacterium]